MRPQAERAGFSRQGLVERWAHKRGADLEGHLPQPSDHGMGDQTIGLAACCGALVDAELALRLQALWGNMDVSQFGSKLPALLGALPAKEAH